MRLVSVVSFAILDHFYCVNFDIVKRHGNLMDYGVI